MVLVGLAGWLLALVILMPIITPLQALESTDKRLALVVGVAEYGENRAMREADGFFVPPPLDNAVRDANLVGAALMTVGFDVIQVANPTKRELLVAVEQFARRLTDSGDDAVGIFYFAGHGAQGKPPLERDLDNYLIPIGADLQTEVDLDAETLGLSRISETLSRAGAKSVVLILDACRDFPLPLLSPTKSIVRTRGLAEARAAPGALIAYSTRPGDVAYDGPQGGNGPYAIALANAVINAVHTRLEDIFYQVRAEVLEATAGEQQPWENSSLLSPVVLDSTRLESPKPEPILPAVGVFRQYKPGDKFKDCDDCPEMVVVPAGTFIMGSPENEKDRDNDEGPQQRITIEKPFAIGIYEITFEQWNACIRGGGCGGYSPNSHSWGQNRRPVINVMWKHVDRYLSWLRHKTDKLYRLPTEIEWEYATRAGTPTRYSWGNVQPTTQLANFGNIIGSTTKVGMFPSNEFGLHDTHGNVWEIMGNCWFEDYQNTSAVMANNRTDRDCDWRVLRGGSWYYGSNSLRSANRLKVIDMYQGSDVGFRVFRSLE